MKVIILDDETGNLNEVDISSILDDKADKVSGAIAGNLASLDAGGNLQDSGKKPSDFALATDLTSHTSATLTTGVHGIATTADMTLYVDATNGDDSNPGTQSEPLQTIQAAINKIPQIVNHTVTINVAPGTYNESPTIEGFVGKGIIQLFGGSDLTSATNYVITGQLKIENTGCYISITGFKIDGTGLSVNGANLIHTVYASMYVQFHYVIVDGTVSSEWSWCNGLYFDYGSHARVWGCQINNCKSAAMKVGLLSHVFSQNNQGSGNGTGLWAVGGIIQKTGTQPSGTTAEVMDWGGQIW